MGPVSIIALAVAGVIHLLPLPGLMGVDALRRLYGVEVADPNVAILWQHRALVFGLLGAFMLCAIPWQALRLPAGLVGLASALGFLLVARQVGSFNEALARVVAADVAATVALAIVVAVECARLAGRT